MKKEIILLLLIVILAIGIRFYNFPNRVTFWSEQARSLVVSAQYLTKPSLLGQEYFIRQASNGHTIFSGALFNYSLVPLLFLGSWDPVKITVFFTLLNVATGVAVYFVARKLFGTPAALLSAILFLFNDYMIYHSLFIWIYNYLPLVGLLGFYFVWINFKKPGTKNILISGIISGIGISLQILFVPFSLLMLVLSLWRSKRKIIDLVVFGIGNIIGNLPMVLFDVRHGFYNTVTIFQYLFDTFNGRSNAAFSYYYLLPLWPVAAIFAAIILTVIFRKGKVLGALILAAYLFFNLTSQKVDWKAPTGMPKGITVSDIDVASQKIAKDANGAFNVSEVLDFDKRAYVFRYFVQYKYGKVPLGEETYQNLNFLYVLAPAGFNFKDTDIWEIKAGWPYKVSSLSNVDGSYGLYKLSK